LEFWSYFNNFGVILESLFNRGNNAGIVELLLRIYFRHLE
jgi:hypothetical protein